MKTLFRVTMIVILIVFTLLSFSALAEEAEYYVIIGAFTKENNAKKFTGYVRNQHLDAVYEFNKEKNLYYVLVMRTERKEEARNWAFYLQHETKFKDAWMLTEFHGRKNVLADSKVRTEVEQATYGLGQHEDFASANESQNINTADKISFINNSNTLESLAVEAAWNNSNDVSYISNIQNIDQAKDVIALSSGKVLTFIFETSEGMKIPGEVSLVNYEKAKIISSFHAGEYAALKNKNKSKLVTLVTNVFGYREEVRSVNLNDLSRARDVKKNSQGIWEVHFKLKPLQKDDVSIMYNTSFYKDAAVLQPASEKEMGQLLAFMKSNPRFKITIHSHCNKGPKREIKVPSEETNYFDITNAVEKKGGDKQLTKERAEALRTYLISNGIEEKRISVFAWGGMDMIVENTGPDTSINDRIEIEVLNDK